MNLFFGLLALVLIVVCVFSSHYYYTDGQSGYAIFWAVLATINFFSAIANLTAAGRDY